MIFDIAKFFAGGLRTYVVGFICFNSNGLKKEKNVQQKTSAYPQHPL
jgi:hypothetical protein